MTTRSNAYELTNKDTGEIQDGVLMWVPKPRKNAFKTGWIAMANDAMGELLDLQLEGKLTQRDMQTLYAMLEVIELENYIRVSQKALAERLRMQPPNISRSVKALVANHVILLGPKVGTSSTYRLNPTFGWKGKTTRHQQVIDEEMKIRMKAANIEKVITNRDPKTVDFINGKADVDQQPDGR